MKTTFFLMAVILAPCLFFIGCNLEVPPQPAKSCLCKKTFKVPKCGDAKGGTKTVTTSYNCRQIVVTYKDRPHEDWAEYLDSLGFHKVKSCPCAANLELWELAPDKELDLIGVVDGAKPPPDGVGGMGLNFSIDLPDTIGLVKDTSGFNPEDWLPQSSPVRVAIIDSGVDPANGYITRFLVDDATKCGNIIPFQHGINMVDFSQPPLDLHGHGTEVNGVLVGVPDYVEDQSVKLKVPVEMLNVKFTVGNSKSGSLFDAVCGMYYAIGQDAVVLNTSWGYLDTVPPAMMEPLLETMPKEVVLVAGMGNDSLDLTGSEKFWPAAFAGMNNYNVISVGALNKSQTAMAVFSNRDNAAGMTLTTWGENIVSSHLTTTESGTDLKSLVENSGTSFATPIVCRAIVFGQGSRATSSIFKSDLQTTAINLSGVKVLKYSNSTGAW